MKTNDNAYPIHVKDPLHMKKCPKCGSKNYDVSRPIQNWKQFRNGKLVKSRYGRMDVGEWSCCDCDYKFSY